MHRVGSAGNTASSTRPRKEKRFTYVLNDADDTKHCAGINCLAYLKASTSGSCDYLFSGSRDGTLKRWALKHQNPTFSGTFESHVDWVNDAIVIGDDTLVSCSSDTTIKTWSSMSDGVCTRTFRQHSDYVTCLAGAEKNKNMVASGGLGGEVFIWDIEAALSPVSKSNDNTVPEDEAVNNGNLGMAPMSSMRVISSSNNITASSNHGNPNGYAPIAAKGHKDSVYALAMNDAGTILVSGGTEKVVRVWDSRTGTKNMKLRGHTDNIRALLIDSTGRYCLSGSSDSMIRLWDLGQQRCVHSYAVHTDSVWALAASSSFTHVYSGGRDQSLYLTDLSTRESVLVCNNEYPILQLALQDEAIWVATTDSSVYGWPADGNTPHKMFQKGGSFLAGNLSFSRARASLEGSAPVPVYREPCFTIPGLPAIIKHEILNNRRHVLTKDTAGSVKLWDITKGVVIEDYGKVSFEEKNEELFERVSIPAWFTMDTRLGCLSVHLDMPQCFSAEMYALDLNLPGFNEDAKLNEQINLAHETLKGLLSHWLSKRKPKSSSSHNLSNGTTDPTVPKPSSSSSSTDPTVRNVPLMRAESSSSDAADMVDHSQQQNNASSILYSVFEFPTDSPPSIITEGAHGGPWRKKCVDLDGTEDDKDLPWWCIECVTNGRFPKENTKCSFYLQPLDGSPVPSVTQGKLSAPRILRIHKVVNYVVEKFLMDKPLDPTNSDGTFGLGAGPINFSSLGDNSSSRAGSKPWQKLKPTIEVLCNNQVLPPEMSLATVKTYVWKKSEDLTLHYRIIQAR